jgi:hypothetical protein
MRTLTLCLWFVVTGLISTGTVAAQTREGGYSTAGIKGITVLFMSDLQPASSNSETWDLMTVSEDVIHRVLYDKARSLNFGYDLRLEPIEGSTKVMVSVEPISPSAMNAVRDELGRKGKPVPAPSDILRYPAPQVVEEGDAFSLEIAVNRQTGVKLVDLLMVSRDPLKIQQFAEDQYPARQFTIDDVHMMMSTKKLLVNGDPVANNGGTVSGPILYLGTPDRGRFLLSFRPYAGYAFQKAGTILVNKMTFTLDGDHFELVSSKPVMGDGGKWDLWVVHEPDYPASGWHFGAMGLANRPTSP